MTYTSYTIHNTQMILFLTARAAEGNAQAGV